MAYFQQQSQVFSQAYLEELQQQIWACPYFVENNLNRDFISTKGFSVVFQRSHLPQLAQQFPYFLPYVERALQPDCNAFYLNPLWLKSGSRVDPHIDRSLRSYCKTVDPPAVVSVLYVMVAADLEGGDLILRSRQRQVGRIRPQANTLIHFQGDLTHSIRPVTQAGSGRLSLVCEQYSLTPPQLEEIPKFTLESRAIRPTQGRQPALKRKSRRAAS